MKSGNVKLLIGIGLLYVILNNHKKKKFMTPIKKDPNINQYFNRFIEFFEPEYMDDIWNEYSYFLGIGMTPNDAFEMTVAEYND